MDIVYEQQSEKLWLEGHLSEPFKVASGVQRGCPMSPLLFNLVIEILASLVRQNKIIKGVKCLEPEVRLSLFADDIVLFLQTPEDSLKEVDKLLSSY